MRNYAMLGKWHVHAEQYANEINRLEGCRIAKVWDPCAETARAWAEQLGNGCVPSTVEDILSDAEIEGVVITTATNEHPGLMERCCAAGKAVFTEKVLALKNEDAESIRAAVVENHTRFGISFPHLSEPWVRCALETAKSGKLGKLNYARVRKAHDGATAGWLPPHFYDPIACGGGAMIDLGAHPMYLLCEIFGGDPVKVQSAFTKVTGKAVEDNAVSLLTFEGGAVGVSETSFVSKGYPLTIEIGGDKGTLLMHDGEVKVRCGKEWEIPEQPAAALSPLEQWALAEKPEDIPASFGIDAAVRLTRVMVAAYAE